MRKIIRALKNSGSQKSYAGERVNREIIIHPTWEEKNINCLFGGNGMKPLIFSVEMNDLNQTFKFRFAAFSCDKCRSFTNYKLS